MGTGKTQDTAPVYHHAEHCWYKFNFSTDTQAATLGPVTFENLSLKLI